MEGSNEEYKFLNSRSRRKIKKKKGNKENEDDKQFISNFQTMRNQHINSKNKENSFWSIISLVNMHKQTKNNSNLHFFNSHHILPDCLFPSLPRNDNNKHYLILKIKQSTIKQKCLFNKEFKITSQGVVASQKRSDGCVSIGRQQINDFGERINDIYLFPTDACISRSHCKIFYSDFLSQSQKSKDTLTTLLMINHARLNQFAKVKNFPQDLLFRIAKFAIPKKKLYLQDNDTIYGTYLKIKQSNPFTVLKQILPHFIECYQTTFPNKKLNEFLSKTEKNECIKRSYLNHLDQEEKSKKVMKLFEKKMVVLKDEMNFLYDNKAGFVVLSIGSFAKAINSMNKLMEDFGSECNDYIEIKSNEKMFNDQKFDISSKIYKLMINKSELLTLSPAQLVHLNSYSFLYIVLSLGDPCGIMNRGNEYLFVAKKDSNQYLNFNLNIEEKETNRFVDGYLFSKDFDSAIQIQSESEFIIYYNCFIDRWGITSLKNSKKEDNFGLWLGTSPDKRKNVRFHQNTKFMVKDGDYIKISETIMKLKVMVKEEVKMDIS
jgi:hypothetical protein